MLPTASRPLPTTASDYWNLLVLPPHSAERVAHFADGGVGSNRFDDRRHQVRGCPRRRAKGVERSGDLVAVARPLERFEFGQLRLGGRLVDVQDLDRRL